MKDRLGNEVNAGDFIAVAASTSTSNAEIAIARVTIVTDSRAYYEVISGRLYGSYLTSSFKFVVLNGAMYADSINRLKNPQNVP